MKPMVLEFGGLHSYRERQTIDFQELGRFGLFGIFGPTGSGKSTILDAITLALFGTVDRAPRKTYGIINQLESAADISFTFELGGQRYTAQRRYERSKEDVENVKSKYSRVIKHSSHQGAKDEVVAEGLTSCDEYIKGLLGFGAGDFLRAVVLPQGKFDQFLRLKPYERGAMLENIFGLEEFGEELRVKVKNNRDLHCDNLTGIEAAQLELGDCSLEALEAAKILVETLSEKLECQVQVLEKVKSIYEEQVELKELSRDLKAAIDREAGLEAQKEHIDLQTKRVEFAKKALPLRTQIEQVSKVQKEVAERKTELSLLEATLNDEEKNYREVKKMLEEAQARKEENMPHLLQKKSQLEKGVQDKKELEETKRGESQRKESLEEVDKDIKKKNETKENLEKQLCDLLDEEKVLLEQEADLSVDPSWREDVYAAYDHYLDLKTGADRVENVEKDLMKKKKTLDGSKRGVLEVFNQIFDISASRYVFVNDWELKPEHQIVIDHLLTEGMDAGRFPQELRTRSCLSEEHLAYSLDDRFLDPTSVFFTRDDLIAICENEKMKAQTLLNRCRAQKEQALILEQASVLARELKEGEPCPVCGSLDHPAPCVSEDPEIIQKAQEAEKLATDCLNAIQNWYVDFIKTIQLWDNAVGNHQETVSQLVDEYNRFVQVCDEFLRKAESILASSPVEEIWGRLARDGKERAYDLLKETESASVQEVLRPYMDEVSGLKRVITLKDKQMELTRKQIKDVQARILKIRQDIQDVSTSLNDLSVDRSTLAGYLEALKSQIQTIAEGIEEICGDEDPSELLNKVESEIAAIEKDYRNADDDEKSAQKKLTNARLDHHTAKAALEQLEANFDDLSRSLLGQLKMAGFDSQEQAAQYMLSPLELEDLEKEINDYNQERIEVRSKIEDLRGKIDSREFSEEAFNQGAAALKDAQDTVKQLTEEVAVAKKELDNLKKARQRWEEHEAQRKETEKAIDIASKLLNLVSGRRFVQFLAQEHLKDMVQEASITLGTLTGQRYALELSDDSEFVIRDDFNGGERRSVTTLSGGEIFLTSLALALALSSKIQLRGEHPLGFFFLDEGFGTLDSAKLDLVMDALERIRDEDRMVGIISHVKELKERLPCYLEVIPAKDDGTGSEIKLVC